ncbi:MAG: type II toxin-antitoxin system RelE/ParE family toxin [Acidobacteria bacterium]|nr:type II toxin-antitoxin system RelE/ParE family toxin [Acidobacteriota bacterium]
MELWFFEEAAVEVEDSRMWYRERSLSAEAGFLRELDQAIEQVLRSPHRWPPYEEETRRYVFSTFPFSLIYFMEGDILCVAAVAHHKRKSGYWRKRLRR